MLIKFVFVAATVSLLTGCGDQSLRNSEAPSVNPKKVTDQPKMLTGNRGQVNLGNTCYFNALMQVLVHSEPVVEFVTKTDGTGGPVMAGFKKLVQEHWDPKLGGKVYNPNEFLELCRNTAGYCFGEGEQEDAHEAYQAIMGIVEDEKFAGLFNFKVETVSRCSNPDREYRSQDTASYLGVTIPESKSAVQVEDYIAEWGVKTTVPGKCGISKIDNDDSATREYHLASAPEVLVVVLSRVIDHETKRMTPVTFKSELDLAELLKGRLDAPLMNAGSLKYKLTGVVHHHGQKPRSGHYVADYLHPRFDKWFNANDGQVSESNAPGITPSDTPYILIYRHQ